MRLPIRPPSKPPTAAPAKRLPVPPPATAAPSSAPVPAPSNVPVPSFGPRPDSGSPAQAASDRPIMAMAANLATDISTPGNRCVENQTQHGWCNDQSIEMGGLGQKSGGRREVKKRRNTVGLAHDPKKWEPVFANNRVQAKCLSGRQHQFGAQTAERRGVKRQSAAIEAGKLDHDRKTQAGTGLGLV